MKRSQDQNIEQTKSNTLFFKFQCEEKDKKERKK